MRGERSRQRFVADTMLGELARWLRILGYDTLYSRVYTDKQLLDIAEKTGRILLTRDWGLYVRARKRGLRAVYVNGDSAVERLALVAARTGIELKPDPARSRCPKCNAELVIVRNKEKVKGRVPPKSYEAYNVFYVCPKCGIVYWEGGHWKNIRRLAREAEDLARRIIRETRRSRRGNI